MSFSKKKKNGEVNRRILEDPEFGNRCEVNSQLKITKFLLIKLLMITRRFFGGSSVVLGLLFLNETLHGL